MARIKIDGKAYSVRDYHPGRIGRGLEALGTWVEALEWVPKWAYVILSFIAGWYLG